MSNCSKCKKIDTPEGDILARKEFMETYADRNPLHKFLRRSHFSHLCKNCIEEIADNLGDFDTALIPDHLKEGIHFYMENGLMVLTSHFHLLRGSCCESGCRHCPYGYASSHK